MKILAIHSIFGDEDRKKSAVDTWRIWRPIRELKKHVDWQIDEQPTLIKEIEKYKSLKEFTEEELEKAVEHLSQYDIIFSSYMADPSAYSLLKVLEARYGTQYVLDVDDDMFHINEDNPFWITMTDRDCFNMQMMVRDNRWITTTNERLADTFRERRNHPRDSVMALPNFIHDDYKEGDFNNSPDTIIGYFGGSSHFSDLHNTGAIQAVAKVLHERKDTRFRSIGMIMDRRKVNLPSKRIEYVEGKRFNGWFNEIFPSMKLDIALGPLEDNIFNVGKSDIKWQEATRAGSVFVASAIGPYKDLGDVAILVEENTIGAWYDAIKKALDPKYRVEVLTRAKKELSKRRLEDNWEVYKDMFEKVKEYKDENTTSS